MTYLNDAAKIGATLQAQLGADTAAAEDLDHLPRTDDALSKLNIRQRILTSAATLSGCPAVGYYVPNSDGSFTRAESIEIYDFNGTQETPLPPTITHLTPGSFADATATRRTSEQNGLYQIPLYSKAGRLEAMVVLAPPTEGYMRVQSEAEAKQNADWQRTNPAERSFSALPDMHESAEVRTQKLAMAENMVTNYQRTLVAHGEMQLPPGRDLGTRKERDAFLLSMAKDMFKTFPQKDALTKDEIASIENAKTGDELRLAMRPLLKHSDAMQGAHAIGTADLMKYCVDALREERRSTLSRKEGNTVELLAMLHDIGKAQFPYSFFQGWKPTGKTVDGKTVLSDEEKTATALRDKELFKLNANHAYLDHVALSLFPNSAKIIADHHHGHDRYSQAEIDKTLGKEAGTYIINTDHVPAEDVHMLSRLLRVADVADAMTARSSMTLDTAMRQLVAKGVDFTGPDGKPCKIDDALKLMKDGKNVGFTIKAMDPNTIDLDALCFMIEHKVFDKFGAQRDRDERAAGNDKGWADSKGNPVYTAAAVDATGQELLKLLHWDERKQEITRGSDGKERTREANLLEEVHDDAVFNARPARNRALVRDGNSR